jgi:SAM-dependent methyltransferase
VSEPGAPTFRDGAFLIKQALRIALAEALRDIRLPDGELTLLDVGGRGRPYAGLVAESLGPGAGRIHHFVLDPGLVPAGANVVSTAELLPIATGSAGMVLCTQVLEHVADPRAAVSEMARVLRPGGVCLLSTHGTWFYHPDPEDFWRWTPAGLTRLFGEVGFERITVRPVGGTKLSLAALVLTALDRASRFGPTGALLRGMIIAPCNRILWRLLKDRITGRESHPGELVIDYIVTATRARSTSRGVPE